jgi:hypothetical protein
MPIRTYSPRIVEPIVNSEVAFTDGVEPLDQVSNIVTVAPILAVATSSSRSLLATGSQSLIFRDFGIPSNAAVVGIELLLTVTRLARVQDRQIQLCVAGHAQGENRAVSTAEDSHVYGAADDLWGTAGIQFHNPQFGVIIDLQPHAQYPSNNTVYLRSVVLRVHTL